MCPVGTEKGNMMSRFTDKLCPVCRTAFAENDDVVVCPECGTPHHRDCYKMLGRCGVSEYHEKGFVWDGRLPDEQEKKAAEEAQAVQSAASVDPHHAEYPAGVPQQDVNTDYGNDINSDMPEMDALNQIPDPYKSVYQSVRQITEDETRGADGVSGKELCYFAGRSIIHYSQAFNAFRRGVMKDGKIQPVKLFLNICSGLFAPIFQFYRRMDGLAIAILLVNMLTAIPEALLIYAQNKTLEVGIPMDILNVLCVGAGLVNLAMMILLCVFGDYLYYKFCVRRIKRIRTSYDDGKADGYYAALTERGAPSRLRIVIGVLAYLLAMELAVRLPVLL